MAKRPFQRGEDIVWYALIIALAVLVVIGVVILLGQPTPAHYFSNINNAM